MKSLEEGARQRAEMEARRLAEEAAERKAREEAEQREAERQALEESDGSTTPNSQARGSRFPYDDYTHAFKHGLDDAQHRRMMEQGDERVCQEQEHKSEGHGAQQQQKKGCMPLGCGCRSDRGAAEPSRP